MTKYRRTTVILAVVLVAVVLSGTAVAYMFRRTEAKNNQFTPAQVSCEIDEELSDDGDQKVNIWVRNTGNINAYLRLRFVTYWVDADGNILGKPATMAEVSMDAGWLKGSNDTYYYYEPVSPEESTGPLLAEPIDLPVDAEGNRQVIEVIAEAIQSVPTDAVKGSWGVTVNDTTKEITGVP